MYFISYKDKFKKTKGKNSLQNNPNVDTYTNIINQRNEIQKLIINKYPIHTNVSKKYCGVPSVIKKKEFLNCEKF
jgi:ribosomal protein L33